MTKNNKLCPVCEVGELTKLVCLNHVTHRRVSKYIKLHGSSCDHCKSHIADAEQVLENKKEIIDFKMNIDDILDNN